MRIFTAITLPATVKEFIWKTFQDQRNSYTGIKWVEQENLHLTLRFFGDVSEETLRLIQRVTREVAQTCAPFDASLGSSGCFPERGSPRVLWVGLETGKEAFLSVGAALDRAYRNAGLGGADKKLSPHITVARVKQRGTPRRLGEEIRSLTFPAEDFRISSIDVYESKLRPQGPLYRVACGCELGKF
jgi:2'-5' RNA ligase